MIIYLLFSVEIQEEEQPQEHIEENPIVEEDSENKTMEEACEYKEEDYQEGNEAVAEEYQNEQGEEYYEEEHCATEENQFEGYQEAEYTEGEFQVLIRWVYHSFSKVNIKRSTQKKDKHMKMESMQNLVKTTRNMRMKVSQKWRGIQRLLSFNVLPGEWSEYAEQYNENSNQEA